MDLGRPLKWIVVVVVIVLAWKYGWPWLQQKTSHATQASATASDTSCMAMAERASDAWGSGIGHYANPPYDVDAWSRFRSDVESKITAAESACGDGSASSTKVRDAMRDLRSLASDLDSAIRSGAPPSGDIVQRQGAIDAQLDAARDLVRAGK